MTYSSKFAMTLMAGTLCFAAKGFAIGDQHGVFRSQSTQGAQWMGTATIEQEEFRITVHPNYLDVELDWTFRVGGTAPEKFQDALEIVGNLNLAKNSVVVGMLTWWKGDILKGKLKTQDMARADYESVVQRDADAPPPPRDPVLIEYGWGIDNYDISIFPATFGETRKVRLHYLVPGNSIGGTVKMPYPHAFTSNAKVSVQAGSDIASYKVEAGNEIVPFDNKVPQRLSETAFAFGSHGMGGTTGPTINYLVPVLTGDSSGSRFYVAEITQGNLQAQAGHIVVMDAQKIIAKSNLKEDFVILWRWSHLSLLEAYAGQIVSQSQLLKSFLGKLQGADKRAALIIDKEGGERITFSLAKQNDAGYLKMVAYLDSLAKLTVVEPPQATTRPNYNLAADVKQAQSDFEAAIQAAMALFENNDHVRHLLLLTAGPQIIYSNTGSVTLKLDSTLHVGSFTEYAKNLVTDRVIAPEDQIVYWPGINPSPVLTKQTLNLGIEAIVSNGSKQCTLSVASPADPKASYSGSRSEIEKHVFSKPALIPKIQWTITQENKVVATFEENAQAIPVENELALAQMLGASRALIPMTETLPRSLAATVGFIDSTYSLVALEEDKLSPADAAKYANAGVPDLLAADIHGTASDLENLAAADWLKANPPQRLWTSSNSYSNMLFRGGIEIDMMNDAVPVPAQGKGQAGAFMPMPIARELSSQPSSYPDYSKQLGLSIQGRSKTYSASAFARIKGQQVTIHLASLLPHSDGKATLKIYDLQGTLVYSGELAKVGQADIATIPLSQIQGQGGLFLFQVQTKVGVFTQKLVLPSH